MRDEIRLLCSGTATPASSLVPKGLALVDRLRGVDSDFGYQFWQVSDTQSIEVRINGGNATVKIFDADEQGGGTCPPYMSGMTQLGVNVYRYNNETGATIRGSFSFLPSSKYAKRKSIPQSWQVGGSLGETNGISSVSYPIDSRVEPRVPVPWRITDRNQTDTLKAGMYTGLMRHVVQLLMGSMTSVVYEYGFQKTHGVYRSGAVDWLIEISAQNGMLAMPMPACKVSVPDENMIGYVPTGKSFPTGEELAAAIESNKVRRLMQPSGLLSVYQKSTFSPLTGWAFNYSGQDASIVVANTLDGDIYKTTYLYKIKISGDDSGPTSATLSLVSSGRVVCQGANPITGYSKGSFKIPSYLGGPAEHIDFGPPIFTDYAPSVCVAPIYVYYKKNGDQVLVQYQNSTISTRRPSDEKRRPRPNGDPFGPVDRADWVVNGGMGVEYVEYAEGTAGNGKDQCNQQFYVVGHKPINETLFPSRNTYEAKASGGVCYDFTPPNDWTYATEGYFYGRVSAIKLIRIEEKQQTDRFSNVSTSIVIPTHDRESVLSQLVVTSYVGSEVVNYFTTTGVGASAVYKTPSSSLPSERREDGLPIGAVLTAVSGSELSSNGFNSSFGVLFDFQGDNVGGMAKGSVGGFAGAFGGTEVPGQIELPWGLSLPSKNNSFAGNRPYNGTAFRSGVYDRNVVKYLRTSGPDIALPKKFSPPDEFQSSPISGPPDPDWFYLNPVTYLLIRSWDDKLRFSPPQLNSFTFELSDFGEYVLPQFSDNTSTINFIGDA